MTIAEIEKIVGWDHKRFYGFDVSMFDINKKEAKLFSTSSAEYNDIIFIAKKLHGKATTKDALSA